MLKNAFMSQKWLDEKSSFYSFVALTEMCLSYKMFLQNVCASSSVSKKERKPFLTLDILFHWTNCNFCWYIRDMLWTLYFDDNIMNEQMSRTSTADANFMFCGGGCLHCINLHSGIFVKVHGQNHISWTQIYFYFRGFIRLMSLMSFTSTIDLLPIARLFVIITRKRSCGKVMLSQMSVILFKEMVANPEGKGEYVHKGVEWVCVRVSMSKAGYVQ